MSQQITPAAQPLPCVGCETADRVAIEPNYIGHWDVYCEGCYDVDCDQDGYFSHSMMGHGRTQDEAIEEWNELVEDKMERISNPNYQAEAEARAKAYNLEHGLCS